MLVLELKYFRIRSISSNKHVLSTLYWLNVIIFFIWPLKHIVADQAEPSKLSWNSPKTVQTSIPVVLLPLPP